MGNKSNFQTTR